MPAPNKPGPKGRRIPDKVPVPDAPPVDASKAPPSFESLSDVFSGMSITGLASLFRQDKKTVSRKLANVKPCARKKGYPVYDVAEAAAWLVKPQIDIEQYMKSLRPADLPPWLQREFWTAMNQRQNWEENAGELWRTEDVIEFLAEVFRNLKNAIMLWNNKFEDSDLSDEDRAYYRSMTDGLLEELYSSLLSMDGDDQTQYPSNLVNKPVPGDYNAAPDEDDFLT